MMLINMRKIMKMKKENEEDKQQNLFREKAKDVLITESFLQNFLLEFNDVLLLGVGNLTYLKLKIIEKIKNYLLFII